MVRNQGRVTRFVVMAVLQAARAKSLGLPLESAYSWGLNRAIFYAAAKRGFSGGGSSAPAEGARGESKPRAPEVFRLGSDEAFQVPNSNPVVFTIGDQQQTPETFQRQVIARFGTPENFRAAWEEALRTVTKYDRAALESPTRFYSEVYRPRRDELSDAWTQKYSPPPKTKK